MQNFDLEDIWKTTLAQLEIKLDSPAHFKTWLIPTQLVEINGKRAVIGVRNSYASEWLKRKYNSLIKATISHVARTELETEFVISKELANEDLPKVTKQEKEQSSLLQVKEGVNQDFNNILQQANLNPYNSFTNFIVGPSNRLAHAASQAVSDKPGHAYNPLFIYGKTGLGKTHLAQAVAHKILEHSMGKKVLYTPSENFLNEMVNAIKTGKTRDFRNVYRFLDLIIIDDIQMISKWEQTQDELFNTFNTLHNKNKQIILVSDRPPEKIHNLESRLRSRFQGGMVIQMEQPDFETRLAILNHKAKLTNIHLPNNIIEYIAENITDNIRQLEGSLQQISLYNNLHTDELSLAEVAKLLGTDTHSKREKTKPADVIKATAKEFQVNVKDILGSSRKADIAMARQVIMYLLREDFDYKLEKIASTLNRKDHTTVMHAVDKVKSKLEVEKGFEEQIKNIRAEY